MKERSSPILKKTCLLVISILILSFAVGCINGQMISRPDPSGTLEQDEEGSFDLAVSESLIPATETTLSPDLLGVPVRRVPEKGLLENEEQIWLFVEFLRTMPYETAREVCALFKSIQVGGERPFETWRSSAERYHHVDDDDWYVLDVDYCIKVDFDYDTIIAFALMDSRDEYSVTAVWAGELNDNTLGKSFHIYNFYGVADFVRRMPQPKLDLFKNEFLMAKPLDWRCLDSIFELDEETYRQSSGIGRFYKLGEGYNMVVVGFFDGEVVEFVISKNYEFSTTMLVRPDDMPYIRDLLARGKSDPNEPLPDFEDFGGIMKKLWGASSGYILYPSEHSLGENE